MNSSKNIFFSLLVFSTLTTSALAADIEAGVVKHLAASAPSSVEETTLSTFSSGAGSPLSQAEGLSSQDSRTSTSSGMVSPAAAATGITYFEIGIVYSTTYGGYETISSSQTSTADHGGAQLFIYVWQYGYGNPNNATMNGISKAPGLSQARCGTNLHVCSVGETVTGWLYGWDYSGQSSGYFTASANSTASPYGYWSDSIYIQ